ncbi:family transcriptional regulator, putative [Babesia ovata]|uniref:Family transcriptional regulator, putative n=1 Tax=Babesia ovata TaxID=189622 RepID=A0A2H6K886_9APIC|nr:family transcriptional regulator, putative [Babesia ovata]GBE59204.1 family transcriptional regulator, putative [Babesia ovata]
MSREVIAELERKYSKATPVRDGVVKVPPKEADVCGVSSPEQHTIHIATPPKEPAGTDADEPVDKAAIMAKLASNCPNMSPAFRLIADAKLCLKGNNQSPDALHRRGV